MACMTLQQIRQLGRVLAGRPEMKLRRLVGSQIQGKLLLEIEAADAQVLEETYQTHRIHYEWILRVEFDEIPGSSE